MPCTAISVGRGPRPRCDRDSTNPATQLHPSLDGCGRTVLTGLVLTCVGLSGDQAIEAAARRGGGPSPAGSRRGSTGQPARSARRWPRSRLESTPHNVPLSDPGGPLTGQLDPSRRRRGRAAGPRRCAPVDPPPQASLPAGRLDQLDVPCRGGVAGVSQGVAGWYNGTTVDALIGVGLPRGCVIRLKAPGEPPRRFLFPAEPDLQFISKYC